jgi:ribosomal protein S18 acetylase RimI-like enzyme
MISDSYPMRPAKISDHVAIKRIELAAASQPGPLVSWPHEIQQKDYEKFLGDLITHGFVVVAEENGTLVGHAYLDQMSMNALRHVFRLTTVVDLKYVGKGFGAALLTALIDMAEKSGRVDKIELLVRASNQPAVALYRKLGFVQEGALINRVKALDGTCHDDLAMARFISKRNA